MEEKFSKKVRLGSGHFGEVWLVTDIGLDIDRALKIISLEKLPDKANFFTEAQVVMTSEHPNVIQVYETGKYNELNIYISMEYHPKGSLDDEAKGTYIDLTRVKHIMIDILRGLEFAHSKGVIHRDIKPANILIGKNSEGILSDFGLALIPQSGKTIVGASDYAYISHLAPEAIDYRKFSIESDIYACGVTLYRLLNGDSFLPILSIDEIKKEAKRGTFPDRQKYRDFIPKKLRKIVNKSMDVDPKSRYKSARDLRRALEQLEIHMNWREQVKSDNIRWIGLWDHMCYEVIRGLNNRDKWYVSVKKGRSVKRLRRINQLCKDDIGNKLAVNWSSKIMQDIVNGKRP